MDKGVWEEAVRKNADKKIVGPYNRCKEGVCTTKMKGISAVEREERGGKRIYEGTVKERIHPTIKVTTNSAGIFCGKEEWEEKDGARLQVSK